MLAQVSVQRFRAGLGEQGPEHHVLAAALGKMLAIGLAQRADTGVGMLLVDAAGRIAMPAVQTLCFLIRFPGHLTLPSLISSLLSSPIVNPTSSLISSKLA